MAGDEASLHCQRLTRRLRALGLALVVLPVSGCSSDEPVPPPDVIAYEYEGTLRVPPTARRTRFGHDDEQSYSEWTAALSFTGDMRTVVAELKSSLEDLGFTFAPNDSDAVLHCVRGRIREDGTGSCEVIGHVGGDGGGVGIRASRQQPTKPGTITIWRRYERGCGRDGNAYPGGAPLTDRPHRPGSC